MLARWFLILIIELILGLTVWPAEKAMAPAALSDADARAYLLKKSAAAEAENAILMRYAQYKQQQEAFQQAFDKDMERLQPAAKKAVADFQAVLDSLRKAAKCPDCELDADLAWKPKPAVTPKTSPPPESH